MVNKVNSFNPIDDITLAEELGYVYRYLKNFQNEFYQHVLAIPGMELSELPLIEKHSDGVRDKFSSDINYYFYPRLFWDVFPEIDKIQLNLLCITAQLYAESLIQLDKVIDDQLGSYSETMKAVVLIGSQYKLAFAIRKLGELFNSSSTFWCRFDGYFSEYINQILEEKSNRSLREISIDEMERSACGKVALLKIITAGMAELANKQDLLQALDKSQDLFAIGYQLYDDVKDWQNDYQKEQYSYMLRKAFNDLRIAKSIAEGNKPAPEELGKHLYVSDVFTKALQLSADYLNRAKEAVTDVNCPKWIFWIDMERNNVLKLRSDLIELKKRAEERARLRCVPRRKRDESTSFSVDLKSCNRSVTKAILFLQEQERKDYLEAKHLEMISKGSISTLEPTCRWGAVFQRAVVLHTLALARNEGFKIDDEMAFLADLQALIESKLIDRKGGWSYFPGILELPPDIDDLAEILHLLIEISHPDISGLCDEPIALALHDQRRDGSVDTWIADPSDLTSVKAKANMNIMWGFEPDVEVMANFLHGLLKYDQGKYASNIRAGTAYIASRQEINGSWKSTWYEGPYYGTYVCCRHLKAVGGYLENLNLAKRFILSKQKADGGWDEGDAVLNTAYTLTALIKYLEEKDLKVAGPAAKRIMDLQRDNGGWESSVFLKMKPPGKELQSMLGFQYGSYASETMSTAFALRSLLALRKLL